MNRQQTEILRILVERGSLGMNSYTYRSKYIQLPVRIMELKKEGWEIVSRRENDKSVTYIYLPTSTNNQRAKRKTITDKEYAHNILVPVKRTIDGVEQITWEKAGSVQEGLL